MSKNPKQADKGQLSPSGHMLDYVRQRLQKHAPFSEIPAHQLNVLLQGCAETYFSPNELIIQPEDGAPEFLYYVEKGA
ncbi:hypothetical protein, partial [Limnobacter sp.]